MFSEKKQIRFDVLGFARARDSVISHNVSWILQLLQNDKKCTHDRLKCRNALCPNASAYFYNYDHLLILYFFLESGRPCVTQVSCVKIWIGTISGSREHVISNIVLWNSNLETNPILCGRARSLSFFELKDKRPPRRVGSIYCNGISSSNTRQSRWLNGSDVSDDIPDRLLSSSWAVSQSVASLDLSSYWVVLVRLMSRTFT